MENNKQLNLLLACLEDVLSDLEEFAVNNNDFCLDEIASLKEQTEAIKDQRWKVSL